jgi:RNA polymerase sigma-70 factor (ECF subfamily)
MSAPADDADRGAMVARWYAEAGPRLYRYAVMLLADRTDAEDVLHQVFATVITHCRVDPAQPEAYLRTAVRNAAYSLLRQRRTARAAAAQILEPVVPGSSPAEQAALEDALRRLPPEQREVVHLHVYEGMTFHEVARATGESINTVAGRYRYALARLRGMLE